MHITHAFDPFFDINFATAVWALTFEGTYVTCGFRDQHPLLSEGTPQTAEPIVRGGLSLAIPKLLSIRGNCLGTAEDLQEAINIVQNGAPGPIVDSILRLDDGIKFVLRSFLEQSRFGKIVLKLM